MSEKLSCSGAKMNAVAQAQGWANDLVHRESRGPGDTENAMHRLEARYGIPWRTFWTLRYRPPTDIFISAYQRLEAAYFAERDRQARLLKHDVEITSIIAGPGAASVRSALALVGQEDEAHT